jgi:GH25 family lysozyme M1 (1,4-beta-N-acetylmuramidase)
MSGPRLPRRDRGRWFNPCAVAIATLLVVGPVASAQRLEGVDVSEWQGVINWPEVKADGKSFAFVRATRGGTWGSSGGGGLNTTGAGRYDDPMFVSNITGARGAGLYAGAYHYARTDLVGVSTPEDEAAHFLEIAGDYMTAGYLRPVLDLEAGGGSYTPGELTNWALRFTQTIVDAKGEYARPIIYVNRSYANAELSASTTYGGKRLIDHPLWLANWDQTHTLTGETIDPQTDDPPGFYNAQGNPVYPNALGVWGPDTGALPTTWAFWQYTVAPNGTVDGINAAIDLDVFHSELGSIEQFVIPEPTVAVPIAVVALLGMRRWRRLERD